MMNLLKHTNVGLTSELVKAKSVLKAQAVTKRPGCDYTKRPSWKQQLNLNLFVQFLKGSTHTDQIALSDVAKTKADSEQQKFKKMENFETGEQVSVRGGVVLGVVRILQWGKSREL